MSEIVIDIKNVTKIFGAKQDEALSLLEQGRSKTDIQAKTSCVVGLQNVSMEVEKGQIYVVMGLSGSGKSTLIRHINRLIEPTSGQIVVNGEDVVGMTMEQLRSFRRTQVSMVFQKFGLLPHRSVIENVAYGLEVRGVKKKQRLETAQQWIETVGLSGYEDSMPRALSGGQQQRVGLARALAMDTNIILMDEAFSALDPLIRSGMQDELINLQKSLGKTILFITHDFDEALKIGDRIAVLKDGEVQQIGKPEEIVLHPANAHIEEFVQEVNKARAIHIGTIMQRGTFAPLTATIAAAAPCEDVLPLFAKHEWVGVIDEAGTQIGRISSQEVFAALHKTNNGTPIHTHAETH